MESLLALLALAALAIPVLLILALASIGTLKSRMAMFERRLAAIEAAPGAATAATPASAPTATPDMPSEMAQPVTLREPSPIQGAPAPASTPAGTPAMTSRTAAAVAAGDGVAPLPPSRTPPPRIPVPSRPGMFELGLRAIRHWFSVGNVPVKIGMLVLLAGVAALLKYASDQGWLRMPVEFRLAGIALAALAGLVFGWRQRGARRAFALALQGGAIGMLLLTVFAAFKLYALLPAGAAFALSVVLVAGLGVLAVAQDSRTLAVLGVLAGFLAPIWMSTGSGNHVALFSYYALLNAAILTIAWLRPWRILNLLGFAFTWGIGTAWGVLQYDPAKFATTEPFLLLFFAFYLALPILYARRRPASRRDLIDGCLVFGTPLVAFSLQAGLLVRNPLDDGRMTLALCALGLAAIYAVLAWTLLRRAGYAALGQCHALLAVGFATLAVPLALSARATASVFALEGAGAAWLGVKRARRLPQWTGAGLQLAAALAFSIGASQAAWDVRPVANPTFMGALLVAIAGFASAWAYRDRTDTSIAVVYYLWAMAWWCGDAHNEVQRFVEPAARADVLLACAALTGWLAAEVHRRRPLSALALTTLAGFAVAIPLAFAQAQAHGSPFAGNGGWAWLVFALLGVRALVCLRGHGDRFAAWAQFAWWLVWPTALSLLAWYVGDRFDLAAGWSRAAWSLPWLAAAALSLWRWPWLAAPQGAAFERYRAPLQGVFLAVLGVWWLQALLQAGDPAPLPWVALLNPLELAQLAALLLFARWLWSPQASASLVRWRLGVVAAAGFVLLTCMTLRCVHHWGAIAWDARLWSTSLAQASLTVVWSVLGVLGWIVGSRRARRGLWLAGAVLMGVVLAKLVLVDRGHLGNLMGIGSFIAYGLLCTLVGYFAPAPQRDGALDATGAPA